MYVNGLCDFPHDGLCAFHMMVYV